jgi:GT2 family glycosyltransferase
MDLSILVPWCNRPELQQTLRRNTEQFNHDGREVLVVSCGGDLQQLQQLTADHDCQALRLLHAETSQGFNKSACLNLGATSAAGSAVLVLDTDIVLTPDCLRTCLDALADGQCFVTIAQVIESAPSTVAPWSGWDERSFITRHATTMELSGENGRRAVIQWSVRKDGIRGGPGLVMVRREHIVAVGGYNSNLLGWGFEDYDLQIRLQLSLGLRHVSCGRVHHLSHPKAPDAVQSNERNVAICRENYLRGDFVGTLRSDAMRWTLKHVDEPRSSNRGREPVVDSS